MRKHLAVLNKIVIFTMVICFVTACGGQNNVESDRSSIRESEDESIVGLSNEDFIIKDKDTFLKLDEPMDKVKIGEKAIYHRECDEKRAYDTYIYKNFTLEKGLTIFSINLTSSYFETARGVKVGDDILLALEKYGLPDSSDSDCYFYHYQDKVLRFYVDDNNKITEIELCVRG